MAQTLAQILAFYIFQNQEYFALLFENVVDSGDVRVGETGGAFSFFEKTMAIERVRPKAGASRLSATVRFSLVSSAQ